MVEPCSSLWFYSSSFLDQPYNQQLSLSEETPSEDTIVTVHLVFSM